MIEKHIQKLEDLVKQSPDEFNDHFMRTTLVVSIKFSNSAWKFNNFLNWVSTTDGLTYPSLKKKLIDLVVDDIESQRRTRRLNNANSNYRAKKLLILITLNTKSSISPTPINLIQKL